MESNNFVKIIKSSVDNKNLPVYGTIPLVVKAGVTVTINPGIDNPTKIQMYDGDGYINNPGTVEGTFNSSTSLVAGTQDTIFLFYNRYNAVYFNAGGTSWDKQYIAVNLDDFKYCTSIKELSLAGASAGLDGNIMSLDEHPNLEVLDISYNTSLVCTTQEVATAINAAHNNLIKLVLISCPITGDINSFFALTKLNELNVLASSGITGSINPLLDGMAAVRESGDTFMFTSNGKIVYNDVALPSGTAVYFDFDGAGGYTKR